MEKKKLAIVLLLSIVIGVVIGVLVYNSGILKEEKNEVEVGKEIDDEEKETENDEVEIETEEEEEEIQVDVEETYNVEINIEDYGVIALELDSTYAPITVANFVKLVNEGFYDGLTFHRIINGFMMQGGDPEGTGMGGSDEEIKGEFASNGVENNISHTRGVISMARSALPDSASSQFFIVHEDSTFLDGEYATFGIVTSGIEIVDAICEGALVVDDNGTLAPGSEPQIIDIKIVE